MKLKKILVGAVVTSMIFTNSMIGFAETPSNGDVYNDLLNKVETLLQNYTKGNLYDKVTAVKTELEASDVEAQVTAWLTANESTKATLANYGINESAITALVDVLRAELDASDKTKLLYQAGNDADGNLTYAEYSTELKALADRVYNVLPTLVTDELAKFDKDGSVSTKQVFVEILNAVMNDKIGTITRNTSTNRYYNSAYALNAGTKTSIVNILKNYKDVKGPDAPTDANIISMGDVFYDLSDAMVKIFDQSVNSSQASLDELLVTMNMLKVNKYNPPSDKDDDDDDKDSGSGSSGGSTGGSTKTPATGLDKDDQKKLDEVEDQLPQAGKDATDAQKEAAKNAVDDLLGGMTLDTAKDADAQVKAVASTVGKTLAVLDGEKAAEVAGEFADLVGAALNNPNVSVEEQQEMLEGAIRNTFSKLVSNEDASAADLAGVKEEIAALAETVVKNAATLKVRGQSSDGLKAFELTAKDLASTLKKAVSTQADFVRSLEANGLTDVAKTVEKNINLALPEVKATEQVSIKLDAEAAKSLGDSGVGVTVEAKGVNFKLPAVLMQAAKSGLSVTSKPVTKADHLNQVTDAGKMTNLKTVNVSVENGEEAVKGMVELAFSLADLKDVDLDALAVGVFEEGQWTKLDYTIENGMVTFTAPHFSIYSLMTFTPSFEDVDASWAKQYITSLTARGVVSGKSTTAYDPNGTLTRAEFTTMLVKHLGLTNEVTQNFKDVSSDEWYYTYVGQAGLNSLAVGIEAGNFMPNEPITREDMAVMMYRAYKLENGFNLDNATTPFSDNLKISESARDAVYAVRTHGIISGYPDNTFRPEANATRAEAAAMMYLFLNK